MVLPSLGLNLPHIPELTLHRIRLLEKLQLAVQRKLTLIVAPPGYGKTTLVAQFAQTTTLPIAWHSVEERERDIPNLLEHCLTALADIVPDIGDTKLNLGTNPLESAASVTDHLRRSLTSEMVYIMDDVHHLLGSPGSEAWLRAFVVGLPSTCHLVLIGRTAPHLPIAELIARREAGGIGQDDLRFTLQEIMELAEKVGSTLSAVEAYKMSARLNGWPAGVILALLPLPSDIDALLFNGKSGPEAVFDSLAEVMLQAQPATLGDFLLASSTLSHMTSAACQAALQLSGSPAYLTEALHQGLFISQMSGSMVYHPLFREFLQRQLHLQNPTRFIQLHTQAGQWFEAQNQLDEAFDHYTAAQEWEAAAAIAERAAQTYWSQGKTETVLYWSDQLHDKALKIPRLLHTCAMIHTDRYQYDLATLELAQAADDFRAATDDDGLMQVTLLQATIHNQQGEYQQAINQAEPLTASLATPDNLRGYALSVLGTAHLQLGDAATSLRYLESALPLYRATGDAYALAQQLLTLGVAYTRLGRFSDTSVCLQEVIAIRRAFDNGTNLAMALNNLGYHYHMLGEYPQALLTFQEGLQVTSRVAETRSESYLLWSMGDLQRDQGAFSEANISYQKALQLSGKSEPSLVSSILLSLATQQCWSGALDQALSFAQQAEKLAEQHNLAIERKRAEACMWAVRAQQGEPELALKQLDSIAAYFCQQQAQTWWVQTLAICADVSLRVSDTAGVDHCLKQALDSANHPANLQPLVAEIVHSPALKKYVMDHARRYETLVKEIRKLEAVQVDTSKSEQPEMTITEIPTYSLRIWALGQERVERDGHLIALPVWKSAAARQLLFCLMFKCRMSREQIGLALWPDNTSEQIRQKFHTTLHRLRHAVGSNVIRFEDDLYFINPDLDVWCDVYAFEALVQQARLTSPRIEHAEILWRQALDLYKGDLLSAYDADWIVAYREALHQMYLDTLLALGNCIHVRGNLEEAIVTFKRALGVDPYREDIYRGLMTCYADLGERSRIQRLTQELTHILNTELGVAPSLETLTLAQSLLN